jgi:uncharacterized protein
MLSVSFPELEDTLAAAGSPTEAAEAHGSLCGALCAQAPLRFETWLEELLPDTDGGESVDGGEDADSGNHLTVLRSVFSQTRDDLGGDSMQFAPLLPDDDEPLSGRTSALAHWCEGFLYGLGASGLTSLEALPGEVGEIVRDMSEISRANIDSDEATETDEQAYAELVEYIRVGVQLIYDELEPLRSTPLPPSSQVH